MMHRGTLDRNPTAGSAQSAQLAPLLVHQRGYLSGKPLQALDALCNGLAAAIENQLMHADGSEASNVARDIVRRSRERSAGAVGRWNTGVVKRCLVGDGQRGEIAPLRLGQLLQGVELRAHLFGRQGRGGDGPDRVPAIAMPGRTSQRGPGMPTDPDRRVRLLHRERFAAQKR